MYPTNLTLRISSGDEAAYLKTAGVGNGPCFEISHRYFSKIVLVNPQEDQALITSSTKCVRTIPRACMLHRVLIHFQIFYFLLLYRCYLSTSYHVPVNVHNTDYRNSIFNHFSLSESFKKLAEYKRVSRFVP